MVVKTKVLYCVIRLTMVHSIYKLKRQEKNVSENVVCWSRLLQIIA